MSENAVEYKREIESGNKVYLGTIPNSTLRNIDFELENKQREYNRLATQTSKEDFENAVQKVPYDRKPIDEIREIGEKAKQLRINVSLLDTDRKPIDFETYIVIEMISPSKHIAIIMNKETDKEVNRYTLTVNKYGKLCMN